MSSQSLSPLLWNHPSAIDNPKTDRAVVILAHGAGALMDSPFMEEITARLNKAGITVVRFEFPYMAERRQNGKKRPPNTAKVLLESWRQVITSVRTDIGDAPLFIGGKSMGGRMATMVMANDFTAGFENDVDKNTQEAVQNVSGVICLGYPFYAAGKQDKPRISHLETMTTPVLVIQGERDTMGNRETVSHYTLSSAVRIHWLADGNHDLKPRKVSGITHDQHLNEAAEQIASFVE